MFVSIVISLLFNALSRFIIAYIPTNSLGDCLFSPSFPAFVICRLFNDGHSAQHEVIPHSFDLHFSHN